MRDRVFAGLLGGVFFFLLMGNEGKAEIAGIDAFSHITWTQVYEENIQEQGGVVQSVCATEDYIITIENTADDAQSFDTVSAYYRNGVDEQGNQVKPYSLAKRVKDTNWEHGNGMAYNPLTHEIYVALYTNYIAENRGCIYVMDPDTLGYKRTIKISDDYNILGIGYKEDTNQYVIQTNADGQYSFLILDENFQIIEDLGSYAHTAKGNNFQDLEVSGDYILNFPLTLFSGMGDYLHVYSISQKMLLTDPKLDFGFADVQSDEPESLCELEPGVFLAVVNVILEDGSSRYRFYRTELPYYFNIAVEIENGQAAESGKVLAGESFPITYSAKKGFILSSLAIDGVEKNIKEYPDGITLENIRKDHTVKIVYTKLPAFGRAPKIRTAKEEKQIHIQKMAAIMILCILAFGASAYAYNLHIQRERRRKAIRTRRMRRQIAKES